MVKKRRTTTRKNKTVKRRVKKPIGFTKTGKKYAFVFGTKTKPTVSKARYSTKVALRKAYTKKYS